MKRALSIALLLALSTSAGAALHIVRATWGQRGGSSCDATAAVASRCEGKEGCSVYADSGSLCPHPYQGWKEAVVTYSCDGQTYTDTFPETAQIALPAHAPPGVIPSCPGPGVSAGALPESGGRRPRPPDHGLPVNTTSWRVNNDPNLWVFLPDGTCHAQNGYWSGTWQRRGDGLWMQFRIPSTGVDDAFAVRFSADGRSLEAVKNGNVIGSGQRVQ